MDALFDIGTPNPSTSRIIINNDPSLRDIDMIAGDSVELTLELRLDNGKLVKAYHDDPDPKNSIQITGAGL